MPYQKIELEIRKDALWPPITREDNDDESKRYIAKSVANQNFNNTSTLNEIMRETSKTIQENGNNSVFGPTTTRTSSRRKQKRHEDRSFISFSPPLNSNNNNVENGKLDELNMNDVSSKIRSGSQVFEEFTKI
jgi:hypothetical protein